jgi:hypothetical protein
MEQPLRSKTSTIDIYIKLAQYPILVNEIRARMRNELFRRGIVSRDEFEAEIKKKAIESQKREGLFDPFSQEPAAVWQERKARIREFQTDSYFGHNLPTAIFEQIVQEVLSDQESPAPSEELSFNPEVAPWELLFRQGQIYESKPPPEREKVSHHLDEIKAVLIKGMISDQLPYIGVARKVFDIATLKRIHNRRIGRGKIGGKEAGMLLAWKILQQQDPNFGPDLSEQIDIPQSYFIGTECIYEFRVINNLDFLMNQKYRPLEEIEEDYPRVIKAHMEGKFPEKIVDQLRDVLESIGRVPLIVRSSSLLEDNFRYSFAGKYLSFFCPNQDTPVNNLQYLLDAIRRIYASTLNPDAILYRKKNQLIDYDERMAILLQTVRGNRQGRYFFPTVAGVGFSQNSLRWNPEIRREEGFLRIVWGLGTRAVDRVSHDYARLIALSHPQLRPETTAKAIRTYSQKYVDVIDLEDNQFKTLATSEVLPELINSNYPDLRYIVSVDRGDYFRSPISSTELQDQRKLIPTFDNLTRDDKFIKLMRTTLMRLEEQYERPVDIEFTVDIEPGYPDSSYRIHLLQCRPLSQREIEETVHIPGDMVEEDIIFSSYNLIPNGKIEGIRYIIFVNPLEYRRIPDHAAKLELGRVISRLNHYFEGRSFIMMGPGRWGSVNIDLGVRVTYADIHNTKALVEIAVASGEGTPILSYGTHFYQDLVESNIHALPINLDDPRTKFDWSFFEGSENQLAKYLPDDGDLARYLKVIDISEKDSNRRLTILMDGVKGEAVGFLESGSWVDDEEPKGTVSTF